MKWRTVYPIVMLIGALAAWAFGAYAAGAEAIYRTGKAAFEKNDYLSAAKHLFAYRNIAKDQIDEALLNSINDALSYCDDQITLALRTKEELDKYGHVTEVVIETSGKADDATVRRETRNFHKPTGRQRRKPRLPADLPQATTDTPTATTGRHMIIPMQPTTPSDQTEAAAQTETLEKEIKELKLRNKQLDKKYTQRTEDYAALKARYKRLAEEYKALRDQQ